MPYTKSSPHSRHGKPDLVQRMVDELRKPNKQPAPDLPDIREDTVKFSGRILVHVIWDDEEWASLPKEHRGEIILDAYEEACGQETAKKVMLAMGLTRVEAERLGIA